jgi:hypothetical protein
MPMSTSAMEVDGSMEIKTETTANYTILRIKRKRTDEPLDALGVFVAGALALTSNFL